MSNFYVSEWLYLTSSGPVTTSGTNDLVHLRQGDRDGTCGPYCLYMALIAMGFIGRSDATDLSRHDGRTREGRCVMRSSRLERFQAMALRAWIFNGWLTASGLKN